ncbi:MULTISPECIES: helix-turn-helix domain-containing protein [Xanthomonas]|uniref:GlxA family transcriptional regulator n=1 Tax=Xanthomonas TaxID=338 RepID=UPI002258C023|nr:MULTISPECIES: helix-turn-helix domain-containing protein [Xanthomonas]MCW0390321.1 HTH-type transcriptional regulator CdhR [Xanthomonas sacchari]MDY4297840.1 helix-turn-helix domain-containing protein [Xanthomonas sp. LF02-5]MDY4359635.1 helix-turn-helix domain-containing protein [Xanthomonas sp. LF04-12]
MSPHRLAVVAFDRISPFHLAVPCQVFEARPDTDLPAFDLRVCAAEPGLLRTDAGFAIQVQHGLEALDDADTVIVPSWRDAAEPAPAALCQALRRAHAAGAQVVGLCLGTFVLADAGLLDGRPATTHWAALARFAQRHPQVRLQPDVLYVDDGDVLTSAGTVAGIDCCLHLVRRRHGADVANRIARRLVVAPHRQGGQAQYIEQPLPASRRDAQLGPTLDWMLQRLDQPLRLDALAAHARMSRRSFTRQFRQVTGTTVVQWLAHQRLVRAQQLLERTDLPLERIAADCGFGSAGALRLQFTRDLGLPPSAYRRGFRAG